MKSEMVNPSENSIEQLFSVFSHELRTPMTCLQGAIELLQAYQQSHQQNNPSELKELLSLAAQSTDRLTQVIENILIWYEIRQGTQNLFKQPCNVALLLKQAVAALDAFAADQHTQINLNTPPSVPVCADQRYLSQTLSYLIHNAIKFSPPHRQVNITATLAHPQNSNATVNFPHVLIAIQDQGIGISESNLDYIFQAFYQVDASDDRRYGGLGLELAICYEVIQQHQGKIWVESQLGQGSTFYVALPVDQAAV